MTSRSGAAIVAVGFRLETFGLTSIHKHSSRTGSVGSQRATAIPASTPPSMQRTDIDIVGGAVMTTITLGKLGEMVELRSPFPSATHPTVTHSPTPAESTATPAAAVPPGVKPRDRVEGNVTIPPLSSETGKSDFHRTRLLNVQSLCQ
ncbi:hypothetical protein [Oscillatoria sp. HE19RPO]|uniref:hypothetical protein n=1 Tax=Oscillatoria sp. HE19RPO TaxID=2954806 RepID=UPI0020C57DC4|nr:hypothetical protein [Oscillatoria sp. HE19RPO]